MEKIGVKRREIWDWYHLVENMNKIGPSNQRLNRIKENLWKVEVKWFLEEWEGCKKKQAINFTKYVDKHRERIPNYELYQSQGICIGSGSVESKIKQIGARRKIVGEQCKAENVLQYLKLRCDYLNGDIAWVFLFIAKLGCSQPPTPKTCLLTDLKMTMWSQNRGSRWLKSGKGDSPTGKYSRPI